MDIIKSLAKAITDDLFESGGDPNSPCHRIEFKGGSMVEETANGGLNKQAFEDWLEKTITNRLGVS